MRSNGHKNSTDNTQCTLEDTDKLVFTLGLGFNSHLGPSHENTEETRVVENESHIWFYRGQAMPSLGRHKTQL